MKILGYIMSAIGGGILGYYAGYWAILGVTFIIFGNAIIWATHD